ncbi:MAG: hypothetical protein H6Q43_26 [Deltaproteobacteria bacterium]|jgi:hypothetical protein|nr:hypothetical protein [Deltaproteobacteria bacterium]
MLEEKEKTADPNREEINLLDLIIVILKYKWMIVSIVLLTGFIGFGYFYLAGKSSEGKPVEELATPILYYSECMIEGRSVSTEKINLMIYRRNFVLRMMEENNLLNEIQQAILAEKKKGEATDEQATPQDVYRWLRQNLFLSTSGGVLTLGFVCAQKDLPPKIINAFLFSLSEDFRKRDLESSMLKQNLLRRQLAVTQDSFLKERIALELITLMEDEEKARSGKYYGFILLDPPSITDKVRVARKGSEKQIESLEHWVSVSPSSPPSYGIMVFLLLLASLVVAVSVVFFLESIEKSRQKSPEKIALLKRYASLRLK